MKTQHHASVHLIQEDHGGTWGTACQSTEDGTGVILRKTITGNVQTTPTLRGQDCTGPGQPATKNIKCPCLSGYEIL